MSKFTSKIAAAFAVATLIVPAAAQAATATLNYFNVQTSTSPNFAAGTVTTWPVGSPVTLTDTSAPTYLRYSVRALVTNNPNPALAGGYLIDADEDGIGETPQPATLGIAAFGGYVTNTSSQITPVAIGGNSTAIINPALRLRLKFRHSHWHAGGQRVDPGHLHRRRHQQRSCQRR